MKIATLGRGTIGGTLARLWAQAGHDVTTFGRDGGDFAVEQLTRDIGMEPLHAGPLELASAAETFALMLVNSGTMVGRPFGLPTGPFLGGCGGQGEGQRFAVGAGA